MAKYNVIVGSFFTSNDKLTLYRIAAEASPAYFLVETYKGLVLESKSVWPIGKITGFKLYADYDKALAAEMVSK
jgi:hypothetical protein